MEKKVEYAEVVRVFLERGNAPFQPKDVACPECGQILSLNVFKPNAFNKFLQVRCSGQSIWTNAFACGFEAEVKNSAGFDAWHKEWTVRHPSTDDIGRHRDLEQGDDGFTASRD